MRKFYLENEIAQRYDLHQPGKVFFGSIYGLGAGEDSQYIRAGDTFLTDYFQTQQKEMGGTMNFLRGANQYASAKEFVNFVYAAKKLKLIYKPDATKQDEYFREVDISAIDKTEIDKDRVMRMPVSFMAKSLYYNCRQQVFEIISTEGHRAYEYTYPSTYNDYNDQRLDFFNDGHADAPIEVEIFGFSERPNISVYQNGAVIKSVEFPLDVQIGEKIMYSTKDSDLYAYLVASNGTKTNLMNQLALSNDNFFKLPIGQSSIKISSSVGNINRISIKIYKLFKVV